MVIIIIIIIIIVSAHKRAIIRPDDGSHMSRNNLTIERVLNDLLDLIVEPNKMYTNKSQLLQNSSSSPSNSTSLVNKH
jgi:hypothetical protein